MNTNSTYGLEYEQVADIYKHYGARIRVKRQSGLCSPGILVNFNKRHASVKIGDCRIERVSLSDLKAPPEYIFADAADKKPEVKAPPTQEAPIKTPKDHMPPDFAPRPAPKATVVPAPTHANQDGSGMGSNIVVLAARIEQRAQEIRAKRAEFAKIEKDYQDAKAVRDAYAGDVQAMEQEYQASITALREATAALLTASV